MITITLPRSDWEHICGVMRAVVSTLNKGLKPGEVDAIASRVLKNLQSIEMQMAKGEQSIIDTLRETNRELCRKLDEPQQTYEKAKGEQKLGFKSYLNLPMRDMTGKVREDLELRVYPDKSYSVHELNGRVLYRVDPRKDL